jgi:hypothetical protein
VFEMNERMGARPWLAHTQLDYAELLAGRDAGRAQVLSGAGLAGFRALGVPSARIYSGSPSG